MKLNKPLFKPGEIARIVHASELNYMVYSNHAEYRLAVVLGANSNIIRVVEDEDDELDLKTLGGEYVLIVNDSPVRVNYLNEVPNPNTRREFGIDIGHLGPFHELNPDTNQQRVVRCRVGFEFRIAKNNQNIAHTIHHIMTEQGKSRGTKRLTTRNFLEHIGEAFSNNVHNIVNTFLLNNSADDLENPHGQGELIRQAREALKEPLSEQGLEFINLQAHPDRRKWYSRVFGVSKLDSKLVTTAKLLAYSASMTSSVVGMLFLFNVLPLTSPTEINLRNLNPDFGTVTCSVNRMGANTSECEGENGDTITLTAEFDDYTYRFAGFQCVTPSNSNEACSLKPMNFDQMVASFPITERLLGKTINLEASFDSLTTLSVKPNDPLNGTEIDVDGCNEPECSFTWRGSVRNYSFVPTDQVSSLLLTITVGEEADDIRFVDFSCKEGGSCPDRNTLDDKSFIVNLANTTDITPRFVRTVTLNVDDSNGSTIDIVGCGESCTRDYDGQSAIFSIDVEPPPGYLLLGLECTLPNSGGLCRNQGGLTLSDPVDQEERFDNLVIDQSAVITPILEAKPVTLLPTPRTTPGMVDLDCIREADGCSRTPGTPEWIPEFTVTPNKGFVIQSIRCFVNDNDTSCPLTESSQTKLAELPSDDAIIFELDLSEDYRGQTIRVAPVFGQAQSTLLLGVRDGGGGSLTSTCGKSRDGCNRTVPWSTSITVTPDKGYRLAGLTCVSSPDEPQSCNKVNTQIGNTDNLIHSQVEVPIDDIPVNGSITILAEFEPTPVTTLDLKTDGEGFVEFMDDDCESSTSCSDLEGWTTSIEATPLPGNLFMEWGCDESLQVCRDILQLADDSDVGFGNSRTLENITVPQSVIVTARFREIPVRPIVFISDRGEGHEIHSIDQNGRNERQLTSHNGVVDESPDWSPDSERIAFHSDRDGDFEIYTANADGSNLRQITDNEYDDQHPSWSPDGTHIAFNSDRDGDREIYTIDLDGENKLLQITHNDVTDESPDWSPNGTQIAFHSDRDGDWEIYTVNSDGGNEIKITHNGVTDAFPDWSPGGTQIAFHSLRNERWEIYTIDSDGGNEIKITNNDGDNHPSWSPDGTSIAFNSDHDGINRIYTIDSDGSNLRRIAQTGRSPNWSPDRKYIAFASNRDGDNDIYIMDADGSNLRQITHNGNSDFRPIWSPDRKYIAFSSNRDGDDEIYIMDADGSNLRKITDNDYDDFLPNWSPSGTHIAFASSQDDDDYEIWIMNADGSNPRQITNNDKNDGFPSWSPDGRHIAFHSFQDDNFEIYTIDLDGNNERQITDSDEDGVWNRRPDWSPDGTRIAFHSDRDGDYEIYTIKLDGSDLRQITNNDIENTNANWSADGTYIAFSSRQSNDDDYEIWIVNADGSEQRQITDNEFDDFLPDW